MPLLAIKIIHVWLEDRWSGRHKVKRLVTNTAEKLMDAKDEVGCWKDKLITRGVVEEQLFFSQQNKLEVIMSRNWCHNDSV